MVLGDRGYLVSLCLEVLEFFFKALKPAVSDLEEAGEVASDIIGLEGYKPKGNYTEEMLGRELSDLLYNIFIIAETYDIDLESVYTHTIDKYEEYLFSE